MRLSKHDCDNQLLQLRHYRSTHELRHVVLLYIRSKQLEGASGYIERNALSRS